MKVPENIKITSDGVTYRGGDEMPDLVAKKLGFDIPNTSTKYVSKKKVTENLEEGVNDGN